MSKLFRSDHPRCPKSGKLRWRTQKAAENALALIITRGHDGQAPVRAYQCSCGGWHLTSMTRDVPVPGEYEDRRRRR